MTDATDDLDTRIDRLKGDFKGLLSQHQQTRQANAELRDRVGELEATVERLALRVGTLEELLPNETDPYADLTRDQKVQRVQRYLLERAQATNGKAAVDYDDVQWSVFDGEPSADHCYTLMQLAAADTPGFTYRDAERPKRLRVDLAATNAEADFSHANNFVAEGGD
jgi:hypothetical protein